jgi:predicted dehydrogenase
MAQRTSVGIGLYGRNMHQVQAQIEALPCARLVAFAGLPRSALTEQQQKDTAIREYGALDELLKDQEVELISLCSPRRAEQAVDALRCMAAGKHVYAEKPCAMTEADLDRIQAAATRGPAQFHEQAVTAFWQPFRTMRAIMQAGTIGEVVQVFSQKSYPYYEGRPQDERVDGGLTMQAGIHAVRMIEQVALERVAATEVFESGLGNPQPGDLRMASAMTARLENGGVATIVANYLNPPGFGRWGNDQLRVFGTKGMLEAVDDGQRTRLIVGNEDRGPLAITEPSVDYLEFYLKNLLGQGRMPFTPEEELHPTRVVIRAKASAERHALS